MLFIFPMESFSFTFTKVKVLGFFILGVVWVLLTPKHSVSQFLFKEKRGICGLSRDVRSAEDLWDLTAGTEHRTEHLRGRFKLKIMRSVLGFFSFLLLLFFLTCLDDKIFRIKHRMLYCYRKTKEVEFLLQPWGWLVLHNILKWVFFPHL